jgi:hypothetical protein
MASLRFRFLDRLRSAPRAVIYVDITSQPHVYVAAGAGWIATAVSLVAFEQEIDRLEAELSEIRREAQLRFAGHAAKRYGADHPRAPFRLQIK